MIIYLNLVFVYLYWLFMAETNVKGIIEPKPKKDEDGLFEQFIEQFKSISGFGKYTQDSQRLSGTPRDRYGHAWRIIDVPHKGFEKLEDMLDPNLWLGNISDAKSLRFYQNDLCNMVVLGKMSLNDPIMQYIFDTEWTKVKLELRVTGIVEGQERAYQAFTFPTSAPKGFGILGRKKKKKEPIEYVVPQEEEEGIY